MSKDTSVRVRNLMGTELHAIDEFATVSEAMALMKRHQVDHLVVNRRTEDDELGVLTVGDIARGVIADNRSPERVNVYEVMTKPLLTVPDDMLARYAVRLLVRFRLSRAVVVDSQRNAIGNVTLRDLIMRHAEE